MPEPYYSVNLRMLLDESNQSFIGEERLQDILSDFSCPNVDVERFLLHDAVSFTRQDK